MDLRRGDVGRVLTIRLNSRRRYRMEIRSESMKVFVTGATGFVGHHVAKALAAEGAELRLLTRKSINLSNL